MSEFPDPTTTNLSYPDFERISSSNGKRSSDRFRCTICIDYGSDDESKTFTRNNKNAHLQTAKHQAALDVRVRKFEEQARDERTLSPPTNSVLLPLPEVLPVLSVGRHDGRSNIFEDFRRLGFTYLDENGEELEFSAGTALDSDKVCQITSEEAEAAAPEYSDSECSTAGVQADWVTQEGTPRDYWPYPSKTVSDDSCQT